jgi:predicted kinase
VESDFIQVGLIKRNIIVPFFVLLKFFLYLCGMEKILTICRGIPGSGKGTFAKTLGGIHVEADQYFMEDGVYKWDPTMIKNAHNYCQGQTQAWMKTDSDQIDTSKIVVSNTFTQEWEMEPYFKLAEQYGYKVFTIVVENRHGGVNQHGVPDEVITKMRDRFEIKL